MRAGAADKLRIPGIGSVPGLVALFGLGCSALDGSDDRGMSAADPDAEPPGEDAATEEDQKLPWPEDGRSPLPSMIGPHGHPQPEPAELCTWAASVDAIVLGTLVDVRVEIEPAVETLQDSELDRKDRWRYVDKCSLPIMPAVVLELEVDTGLLGQVPDRVEVWLGERHRNELWPGPYRGDDGELRWWPDEREDLLVDALRPGQKLGLAIHYVPEHDLWSLMGEIMFGLDGEGGILFQERENFEPGPTAAVGMSPEEFGAAVAACEETSESESRRAGIWRNWGPEGRPPHYYRAATCNQPAEAPDQCTDDSDCEDGMECIAQECH